LIYCKVTKKAQMGYMFVEKNTQIVELKSENMLRKCYEQVHFSLPVRMSL
jgi:hypothetical protein